MLTHCPVVVLLSVTLLSVVLARPGGLPSASAALALSREDQALTDILKGYRGGGGGYGDDGGYGGDKWNEPSSANEAGDYYGQHPPDDRYEKTPQKRSKSNSNIMKHDGKRIGLMLVTSGIGIMVVGLSLFLNKTLVRLGNLLLISGVPVFWGPSRALGFFLDPRKIRASGSLAVGICLVFCGWPILGILLELFGLLSLFGNMFPMKNMPVTGPMLKQSFKEKSSRQRTHNDDEYDGFGGGDGDGDGDDDSYRDDDGNDGGGNGGGWLLA